MAVAFQGYKAFAPEGWEPPDELTPANVERLRGELAAPDAFALMAMHAGDPIGHALWITLEDGLVHLRHLFVYEPWWGTEVARTLHARAVEAMAGRPARLFTPAGHIRARRFYEREGWRFGEERLDKAFGMTLAEYRR